MGINTKFLISSQIFVKIRNGPNRILRGRGKIIREKTWRRKSHVKLACGDFIYKISIFWNHLTATRLHMEDFDFVSWASEKTSKKKTEERFMYLEFMRAASWGQVPRLGNILEQHIWGRSLSLNRNSYEQHGGWALDLDYIKSSIFEGALHKWSQVNLFSILSPAPLILSWNSFREAY
jgi:hypothetical protein